MPSCLIPYYNGKAFNLSCRERYQPWICNIWILLSQGTFYFQLVERFLWNDNWISIWSWTTQWDFKDVYKLGYSTIQFSSVTQSCPTLCNPMNRSTPGLPVHQQLPESTQTHVHWVGDAIQPSHPLSSPSPPAPNPSQHQGLLKWVSSSHQAPKDWSFSFNISPFNEHPELISFRMDWLDLLQSKKLSRVFSNTTVQKHQFFGAQLSSHPTLTSIHDYWKNHSLD